MRTFIQRLLILSVVTVVSCSDSAPTGPVPPQNLDQLLPLAVGNVWIYREKSKFGAVDARFVIARDTSLPWVSSTAGGTRLFFLDSNSFYAYGNDPDGVTVGNLKVNGAVTNVDIVGKLPKAPTSGYVNGGYRYVGTDTVTVPAGTFAGCHVFTFTQFGQTQTEYYMKGVGLVKLVGVSTNNDTLTRDLLQYSLK